MHFLFFLAFKSVFAFTHAHARMEEQKRATILAWLCVGKVTADIEAFYKLSESYFERARRNLKKMLAVGDVSNNLLVAGKAQIDAVPS